MKMFRELFLVLILFATSNVLAAAAIYTDQTAFLTALTGGSTTHDFDDLAHLTTISDQYSGVDFGSTARIYAESTVPSGGAVHTAPNVLLNFSPSPITFVFDTPVNGVGFFNTSIADREEVTLRNVHGDIIFIGELPEGSVNFLGYISDDPIASGSVVGIVPQTFGTIFIDSFSFGDVALVPIPAAIVLLGSAVLLIFGRFTRGH